MNAIDPIPGSPSLQNRARGPSSKRARAYSVCIPPSFGPCERPELSKNFCTRRKLWVLPALFPPIAQPELPSSKLWHSGTAELLPELRGPQPALVYGPGRKAGVLEVRVICEGMPRMHRSSNLWALLTRAFLSCAMSLRFTNPSAAILSRRRSEGTSPPDRLSLRAEKSSRQLLFIQTGRASPSQPQFV